MTFYGHRFTNQLRMLMRIYLTTMGRVVEKLALFGNLLDEGRDEAMYIK